MSESEIIGKYLMRCYPNDHSAIYIYASGWVNGRNVATEKIMEGTKPVFYPAMSEHVIKATIKGFLDLKKKQYKEGLIQIKPLFQ